MGDDDDVPQKIVSNLEVTFCGVTLQPRADVGNLGVTFDSILSWEPHVSELCRRCTGVPTDRPVALPTLSSGRRHLNPGSGPCAHADQLPTVLQFTEMEHRKISTGSQTSLYIMVCAQKIQGPFDLTLGPRC